MLSFGIVERVVGRPLFDVFHWSAIGLSQVSSVDWLMFQCSQERVLQHQKWSLNQSLITRIIVWQSQHHRGVEVNEWQQLQRDRESLEGLVRRGRAGSDHSRCRREKLAIANPLAVAVVRDV